jgi:hypothetical protein
MERMREMDNKLTLPCDVSKVSDGYHTFEELYEHRCALMVALMLCRPDRSWWSELHDDGSKYDGWLIVGMDLPGGTITYHIPEKWRDRLAVIPWQPRAPKWDGHAPSDVVMRLADFIDAMNGKEG